MDMSCHITVIVHCTEGRFIDPALRRITMAAKISKTNSDLEFLNRRLDEIQMSDLERLRARARLAQAEAVAGAIVAVAHGIARLFKPLTARHGGGAAPTAG
jgi:hypothetical protein